MSNLNELVYRLESSSEPDRLLDAEIAAVLRVTTPKMPDWVITNFPAWRARRDGRVEVVHADGSGGVHWRSAEYTSSVDAALTIIPHNWIVTTLYQHGGIYDVVLLRISGGPLRSECGSGATMPIAFCVAALRAKLADQNQ